jgi:hypothetical protein
MIKTWLYLLFCLNQNKNKGLSVSKSVSVKQIIVKLTVKIHTYLCVINLQVTLLMVTQVILDRKRDWHQQ